MSENERRAFCLGYAFGLGTLYGRRQLARDEEPGKIKFRTIKNGNTIAIKDGDVVGGAGSSVGPDKLPTFEWFMRGHPELDGASFTKTVTKYVRELVARRGSPVVKCNGSIDGVPVVATFTTKSIAEIASKLSDSGRDVLPFMFDVMETGGLLGIVDAPKESHRRKRIAKFAYFSKYEMVRGKRVRVQVDVAIMERDIPPAKPYVVGIKEKAPDGSDALVHQPLGVPPRKGGPRGLEPEPNIAKDVAPFKAIPIGIRIVD